MTKIKGTEEHGLLQMIICMIRPPLCSSVPLQMVICKEDGSPDDQNQGDGGAQIVVNDHPDDTALSVPLQMVVCKEDCPSDGQNQRDGGARIVANDHLDDQSSSVPLQIVICKEDGPLDDQRFFWMVLKLAPDLPLVWRILNTKFQHKRTNGLGGATIVAVYASFNRLEQKKTNF